MVSYIIRLYCIGETLALYYLKSLHLISHSSWSANAYKNILYNAIGHNETLLHYTPYKYFESNFLAFLTVAINMAVSQYIFSVCVSMFFLHIYRKILFILVWRCKNKKRGWYLLFCDDCTFFFFLFVWKKDARFIPSY